MLLLGLFQSSNQTVKQEVKQEVEQEVERIATLFLATLEGLKFASSVCALRVFL